LLEFALSPYEFHIHLAIEAWGIWDVYSGLRLVKLMGFPHMLSFSDSQDALEQRKALNNPRTSINKERQELKIWHHP
jgi:hypothetical protein